MTSTFETLPLPIISYSVSPDPAEIYDDSNITITVRVQTSPKVVVVSYPSPLQIELKPWPIPDLLVTSTQLEWHLDDPIWLTHSNLTLVPFQPIGNLTKGKFSATIPAQPTNTVIRFR